MPVALDPLRRRLLRGPAALVPLRFAARAVAAVDSALRPERGAAYKSSSPVPAAPGLRPLRCCSTRYWVRLTLFMSVLR